MELYLLARLHARRGREAALRQAIHDVKEPTRQEPGCLDYHAFQSVRDRDEFYIPLIDHPLAVSLTECLE
jgi:quinol monooxygenase YgiN